MTIAILTGMQIEADTIGSAPGVTVLCGTTARDNLDTVLPADTEAVICWGVCGALSPALSVGQLCISTDVLFQVTPMFGYGPPTAWSTTLTTLLGAKNVKTFSSAIEIANDALTRAQLMRATGAQTVDMGSYAVAEWAAKHGKPWAVISAVSDSWDQSVSSFTDLVDANGNINDWTAFEEILSNPSTVPQIIQEAESTATALNSLAAAAKTLATADWGRGMLGLKQPRAAVGDALKLKLTAAIDGALIDYVKAEYNTLVNAAVISKLPGSIPRFRTGMESAIEAAKIAKDVIAKIGTEETS